MSTLRRRTSEVLSLGLACCLVASLAAAVIVGLRDPYGSLAVAVVALAIAAGATRVCGEGLATFGFLGAVFVVLALGLYALHVVFAVSGDTILWIGGALASLVLVVLGRALIASGSADNPYDD